ncbi:MAG: 16S rRNA (cytosine(1402)-N(4))-methyltransferase RsmH [Persicimonas sp.]
MPNSQTYATGYHAPVMVDEVLDYLQVGDGGRYVDGTAGGGGHTAAILDASAPDGRVLGVDRDPEAIEQVRERLGDANGRLELVQGNYGNLLDICRDRGFVGVDGLLVDAGVSSHQLDEAERGFSFSQAGPLDMRMGPDAPSLAEYLETIEQDELTRVLRTYGEVRSAHRISRAILEALGAGELETTVDLAKVVEDTAGRYSAGRSKIHPATLVFQGLRIAINRELESLERAVTAVPDLVGPGGRAVFISFHSLEDRIVKHGFRELAEDCVCPPDLPICGCDAVAQVRVLTSRPIRPSEQEVERNPRSRSARLRAVEVL